MAVQAQYPANVLLLSRGETERKNKEMETNFNSLNAGNVNLRKRGRDVASASLSPQPQQQNIFFSPENLAAEFDKQKREIEQFLVAQGEQLRREMAEKRQHHYRVLLATVEKSLGNKLREKEEELKFAGCRTADLQNQLNRLRSESMAWQAKALAEQTAAASLQAQLQAAAAASPAGEEFSGEWRAEDAGSAYVDPARPDNPNRPCLICRTQTASVVLLPCRHLCVCPACDSAAAAADGCPACGCFRTGSLQISLS